MAVLVNLHGHVRLGGGAYPPTSSRTAPGITRICSRFGWLDSPRSERHQHLARSNSVMKVADRYVWSTGCIRGGLASGEGVIYHLRDGDGEMLGLTDKRLLALESEFAAVSEDGGEGGERPVQPRPAGVGNGYLGT